MQAVNLLPAYARPGNRLASVGKDLSPKRALTAGGVAAGVAVVALGGLYAHERSVVGHKHSELVTTQAQLTAVQAKAAPFRAVQAQATSRFAAVQTIVSSRIPWDTVLGGLSRVLPSEVYLTDLQATTPDPAAALGTAAAPSSSSTGFTVSGIATSNVRVALVLDRLALMPWLTNVTLTSSTRTGGGPGSTTGGGDDFAINATFNAAGGAK